MFFWGNDAVKINFRQEKIRAWPFAWFIVIRKQRLVHENLFWRLIYCLHLAAKAHVLLALAQYIIWALFKTTWALALISLLLLFSVVFLVFLYIICIFWIVRIFDEAWLIILLIYIFYWICKLKFLILLVYWCLIGAFGWVFHTLLVRIHALVHHFQEVLLTQVDSWLLASLLRWRVKLSIAIEHSACLSAGI